METAVAEPRTPRPASGRLESKVPGGRLQEKWDNYKNNIKLVNPANKRKHTIIVVGTGLAGWSATRRRCGTRSIPDR